MAKKDGGGEGRPQLSRAQRAMRALAKQGFTDDDWSELAKLIADHRRGTGKRAAGSVPITPHEDDVLQAIAEWAATPDLIGRSQGSAAGRVNVKRAAEYGASTLDGLSEAKRQALVKRAMRLWNEPDVRAHYEAREAHLAAHAAELDRVTKLRKRGREATYDPKGKLPRIAKFPATRRHKRETSRDG